MRWGFPLIPGQKLGGRKNPIMFRCFEETVCSAHFLAGTSTTPPRKNELFLETVTCCIISNLLQIKEILTWERLRSVAMTDNPEIQSSQLAQKY
jgi:hypothetical protein